MHHNSLSEMGKKAKQAASKMALATTAQKNMALHLLASLLISEEEPILAANRLDIQAAKASGMNTAMLDRLSLEGRLSGISEDIQQVIQLPDPVREIIEDKVLPNGLHLSKKRTPIGVLGIIYEARPNVTIDVSALTIKTGNCAILRGGSETMNSNLALLNVVHQALELSGLPKEVIQLIKDSDRKYVTELLKLHASVDLIIPRGGQNLHKFCRENSTIPVITGGIGICHLFVDQSADISKSLDVIFNAKTQRPTVCNALDTLLVHQDIAADLIPKVINKLAPAGVSFRLDESAIKNLPSQFHESVKLAGPKDWDIEWLSLVLGIKVVENLEEAIAHIVKHSTGHSDGILTETFANAERFTDEIDSAAVYVNASTRFTDGSQLGMGAEVAISTQKLHARGPMGLEELTSYKWVIKGNYHTRK